MQRWKNSKIASSLLNLLGDGGRARSPDGRLESVRGAMLDELLDAMDTSAQRSILSVKLKSACEIQTLWYLRSDLMQVLSAHLGETEAMQRLDALTQQFKGMVPKPELQSAQRRRVN